MVRRPCRNEILHSPRRDASANIVTGAGHPCPALFAPPVEFIASARTPQRTGRVLRRGSRHKACASISANELNMVRRPCRNEILYSPRRPAGASFLSRAGVLTEHFCSACFYASARRLREPADMVKKPCRNEVLHSPRRYGLTKPAIVFCYVMAGVMCGMKYTKA